MPAALFTRAYSRVHDELVAVSRASRPISSTAERAAALAAVAEAARDLGVPYGLDLEDFHTGEQSAQVGEFERDRGARRASRAAGRGVSTTSSPMIADAYADKYGLRPRAIHNTFSLDLPEPSGSRGA